MSLGSNRCRAFSTHAGVCLLLLLLLLFLLLLLLLLLLLSAVCSGTLCRVNGKKVGVVRRGD
jgi:Trk-type K+ transport system membrane component